MALFLLIVLSAIASIAFHSLHLPAGWLFGPLIVSGIFAIQGWKTIVLPKRLYCGAQAIIGTSLGAGFSTETLTLLFDHLEMVATAVISIFLASILNGWILVRWTRLDSATAFLSTLPGGASAMVAMGDSLHADTRLVAVLQYVRLLIILSVLFIASPLLIHLLPASSHAGLPMLHSPPHISWQQVGLLTFLTTSGYLAGAYTQIPAGTFIVPVVLEFTFSLIGISAGRWPVAVFAIAYLLMGLQIGGRFKRETIGIMKGLFVPVFSTSFILLLISLLLAGWLCWGLKLAPLSAYLAATPGGLDSVAAMAGELGADTGIILIIQMVRLLSVLLLGPWLVRSCVSWVEK